MVAARDVLHQLLERLKLAELSKTRAMEALNKREAEAVQRQRRELGYHLELDLEDPANVSPSKIKPFECSACNATFHMKCFLNMHVRKVHVKDKDVQM